MRYKTLHAKGNERMDTSTKRYEEELRKETDSFMFALNKKDAQALMLHKKKDGIEDIARIATLTLIFGYKKLFLKILANLGKREANRCIEKMKEVSKDFETIDRWVREFIDNTIHEELKEHILPCWEEYAQKVDRKTFSIKEFFQTQEPPTI